MNPLHVLLCLCLSSAPHPPADHWVAQDKLRHFVSSFVLTSLSASAARAAGADPRSSAVIGAGVGVAAGAGKELRDLFAANADPSLKDLAWDLAGDGAGFALMRQVR
jgi:putative lipoprotein